MKPVLAFLTSASIATAAPLPIAIGTNTGGSKSEGIYLSTFDPATGKFGDVKLGAKYSSPGFLALHPTKPLLYSIGGSRTHPKGSLAVFQLGSPLEFLAETSSGGNGPCHLAVNDFGSVLAVANYNDGSTATVRLDENGRFAGDGFSKIIPGKGPRADRQDGPHAHGVYFRGDHLLVPDLGIDQVLTYAIDPATAKLVSATPASWSAKPGVGPRHLDFSPDGKHAYVINELDNTITACRFHAADGSLATIASITTLPDGWNGENTTAEIQVHPNGRFVYASNRGHDSIAVFSRDPETGKLTFLQATPCGGKTPRHFTIAPGGTWLLCAHQNSNTLAALPLDPATGKLGAPGSPVSCSSPICILFLR
ncbi:MAG: lactonase family protein [Verrucomicrobiota bacterium]